jgi:hypothetical protein
MFVILSCEKLDITKDNDCWLCKIDSISIVKDLHGEDPIRDTTIIEDVCNLTSLQILQYEAVRTYTREEREWINHIYGIRTVTTTSTCRCIKNN